MDLFLTLQVLWISKTLSIRNNTMFCRNEIKKETYTPYYSRWILILGWWSKIYMFYLSQLKTAQLHSILSSSKSSWSIHATWGHSVFSHGKRLDLLQTHTQEVEQLAPFPWKDFNWHKLGLWKSLITLVIALTAKN